MEKKEFTEKIIQNLINEKEKLKKNILEETKVNQSFSKCEMLNKDLENYKNIIDSCIKTCSQLTAEIVELKKKIDKLGFNNQNNSDIGNFSLCFINGSYSETQIKISNSIKKTSRSTIKKK